MRKYLLLAAASAAAIIATLFTASSATADGSTVFNAGPNQYSIGFQHPTGTISIGGGTISARCSAQSFRGSAFFHTPQCVTKVITCPATATSCSAVWNVRESAVRGPVAVGGQIVFSGPIGFFTYLDPYNCPQANTCGARVRFDGLIPGETIQASAFNITFAPYLPNVFNQVTLTVN